MVASADIFRSAAILADAAAAAGEADTVDRYTQLVERTRSAFAEEYVMSEGRVLSDAQPAYALAIQWGLLATGRQREHAADRLADLVRLAGFRIGTGSLGTRW